MNVNSIFNFTQLLFIFYDEYIFLLIAHILQYSKPLSTENYKNYHKINLCS